MNCSFCGIAVERGTGMLYVRKDGTMLCFCTKKCRKNMLKLKRKPGRLKWTKRAS